jgi:hypothetical protein
MTKKITKPSKSQLEHIRKPFVDKTGDAKKPKKMYNTVKETDSKYSGNAPKTSIKLKRGK